VSTAELVVSERADRVEAGWSEAAEERRRTAALLAFGGIAAAATLVMVARGALAEVAAVQTFVLVFASIAIEALPFILLGTAVSAVIATYVPERFFRRVGSLPVPLQIPGACLGGLLLPVCECGSVPVARRLILRGIHPAAGFAFMLASPIVNPVVLGTTIVAYGGSGFAPEMVAGRAGLGLCMAVVAGLLLGRMWKGGLAGAAHGACDAHHDHDHGPRWRQFVDHLSADFLLMGRFVVIGAALAALLQTAMPHQMLAEVGDTAVASALALVGLAFVLSLCSEADAFVAISFTAFSLGSQLAFLVFGPVMDAKLAVLYGATFGKGFVLRLALIALAVAVAGALVFDLLVGG
jgi:uncharacterized membrane protein YraQ (UPF0718 family)